MKKGILSRFFSPKIQENCNSGTNFLSWTCRIHKNFLPVVPVPYRILCYRSRIYRFNMKKSEVRALSSTIFLNLISTYDYLNSIKIKKNFYRTYYGSTGTVPVPLFIKKLFTTLNQTVP